MNTGTTQRAPKTPKPTASVPIVQNKRWPPMANRNALPYKLTHLSKEKLAREATAPDPDLRRCVAHFRLHCGSVSWTENDMKSRISSFDFEDTDEEDDVDEINTELPVLKNRASTNETPVEVTQQLSQNQSLSLLRQLPHHQHHQHHLNQHHQPRLKIPPSMVFWKRVSIVSRRPLNTSGQGDLASYPPIAG